MKRALRFTIVMIVMAIALTGAVAGCASVDGDIELAEAIVKDLVEAGPAIKELVEVVKDVVGTWSQHHAEHHDPNAVPHSHAE